MCGMKASFFLESSRVRVFEKIFSNSILRSFILGIFVRTISCRGYCKIAVFGFRLSDDDDDEIMKREITLQH